MKKLTRFLKGFALFLIACLSFCICVPTALVFAILHGKGDFVAYAVSVDQSINAIAGELLNALFLKEKHLFKFGDMDKTISYNLGKNKHFGNLNKFGLLVCLLLHYLDKNHVDKTYNDGI